MKPPSLSLPIVCAALVASVSTWTGQAAEDAAAARSFTLFMGTDLEVSRERQLHLIRDFVDGKILIRERDALVRVPITSSVQFKISHALKLSESAVKVEDIAVRRAYTLGRDPGRQIIAAANHNMAAAQVADIATSQMVQAMDARTANAADPSPAAAEARASGVFERNVQIAANASAHANQGMGGGISLAGSLDAGIAVDNYDAVEVTFKVSSAQPLGDAYVVVIAQYRGLQDKPGHVRNWIYAEELGSLGDRPRPVYIKQGGFPPGFQVVNQEVHFYRRGRELASNVADKAVPLTFDEAHEYLVIDYLTVNKGATLAPSVAIGVGATEFSSHFTDAHLQREIFVKVDPAGRPQGAFRDAACTQSTGDEYLDGLVRRVRFNPALQAGKPVDGVARLKIAGLVI